MIVETGYLLVGVLVLALPGLAIQLAAGVRDKLWLAALTAPVSIGVFVIAGLVSGVPGLSYRPLLVVVVTVVLTVLVATLSRYVGGRRLTAPQAGPADPPPSWLPALSSRAVRVVKLVGVAFCLIALVLAIQPWRSGLGGWSTFPQEHDTIIHTVLVSYISRTGRGAPWELLPIDVLTGQYVSFYPSGLPLTAALSGELAGGPIVGFNVINALCVGPVFVLGCAALAAAVLRRLQAGAEWTALGGGMAAIVAAGLYRPGVNLLHDGGIAPNGVAMSLAPGVIAAILTIGRGQWLRAVVLGIGAAGIFAVHPSVVATVGASLAVFWVAEAFTRVGRRVLREQWPVLLGAVVVAGIAGLGQLVGSAQQAVRTGTWLPDIGPAPLGDAVRTNLMLTYGGYFDPRQQFAQISAAVLALVGVLAVVVTRRAWGALAMWLFWLAVSIDFKFSPGSGFGSMVGSLFYKSYVRVQAHPSLFVPLLAAIGVLATVAGVAKVLASLSTLPKFATVLRAPGPVLAALAVLAMIGYLITASVPYEHRNAVAIASRYVNPEFVRVGDDDRRASGWLAAHVTPGERVLNNANDGSTYAYIHDGVPVVNVVALGAIQAPYTYLLLESFHDYPVNPQIRATLLSLNVGYVYVDSVAPLIGAGPGAPEDWLAGAPTFDLAPGLRNVDGLPGMSVAFRSGTVTVYGLDRSTLAAMRS